MSSDSAWEGQEPPQQKVPLPGDASAIAAVPPLENPRFDGAEVIFIGLLLFVVPSVLLYFFLVFLQKYFYRQLTLDAIAQKPWISLGPQLFWFGLILLCLVGFARTRFHQSLWQAVGWNWPKKGWALFVGIGIATLSLQGLQYVLPMPKTSPFDRFFHQPLDAYGIAFFGIVFGPVMEELFFRGLVYPVLARRVGVVASIFLTAVLFGLIHYPEYKGLGPVLIIFLVGVVLTVVRAKTKSVGASFIVHSTYNAVPILVAIIATHGFRHLDKLTQ